jgi:predicted HTH transcriptional regulator
MLGAIGAFKGFLMNHIYPERESKTLEFKSELPVFLKLIKTCVAFANGVGGQLVIGVEDQTRIIVGISEDTRHRIYDEFPNSLYGATTPPLLVEIYERCFDDRSVIIIEVPSSIKKPVFISAEGESDGTYLRAGSSTRKADSEHIEELKRENKRIHFDEEKIHESMDALSPALILKALNPMSMKLLEAEKIIIASGVSSKKYYPTVTGIIAFCETPDLYLPESLVVCTRFLGKEGRNIIQTEEIRGNLEKLVETTFQLVKSWLLRDYRLIGAKLKAKTIIPEVAFREAIINALIHRKYSIPGAVKIAIYDDRLEIFSPGSFPGLVDINSLGDGTTYLRNPNLARVARRLGLVEKLGTGIKLMIESCKKHKMRKPEFIEGADSVKVVFYFLPSTEAHIDDIDKLLNLFKHQSEITLQEVAQYLEVSRNTATRRLNTLIEAGKIIRTGKGPAVKFMLKL